MRKLSKFAVLVVGLSAAAVVAPAIASAKCNSLFSTKTRYSEHKARQAAIIGVNTKFNRVKVSAMRNSYGTARRLNRQIRNNVTIHPIRLNCHRYRGRYTCKAVKTWCY